MLFQKSKIYESRLFTLEEKIKINHWNKGIIHASEKGYEKLIGYFIRKGAKKWRECLNKSTKENLILFFMQKLRYEYNPEWGFEHSVSEGMPKFIDYFIDRCKCDWNTGLVHSIDGPYINIMQYFISKGADDFDWSIEYAYYEDKKLTTYLKKYSRKFLK